MRPSSVRMMSAACCAAAVEPFTAMPTLAALRAGASLTPSPVMPVIEPPFALRKVFTMTSLSVGITWAKPPESRMSLVAFDDSARFSPWASAASMSHMLKHVDSVTFSSPPSSLSDTVSCSRYSSSVLARIFGGRPMRLAVSMAMFLWSPVIMRTWMPLALSFWITSAVSWRGGSIIGMIPANFITHLPFTSSPIATPTVL
mmetsp:Transcript_20783/g.48201  ORF Transcript_20783/g.48201 Transcript_20783/m.48201 type:complete len:201 (-) Transcript_20783:1487-2089(-)